MSNLCRVHNILKIFWWLSKFSCPHKWNEAWLLVISWSTKNCSTDLECPVYAGRPPSKLTPPPLEVVCPKDNMSPINSIDYPHTLPLPRAPPPQLPHHNLRTLSPTSKYNAPNSQISRDNHRTTVPTFQNAHISYLISYLPLWKSSALSRLC